MSIRHLWPTCALLASLTASAQTPPLTAEAIMSRVAANQDRTESERSHYVYIQHAKVSSLKGHTVMCEETTDTRVTPTPKGQQQQRLTLSGYARAGSRLVHYTAPPQDGNTHHDHTDKSDDDGGINIGDKETILDADANNTPVTVNETDIDLVNSMRRNFTSTKNTKDGVSAGLFPLTSEEQKDMLFTLKGRETKNGRDTFHITFRPKDDSDYNWKGDAWIDTQAFQPVVVRTALSRNIPLAVRLMLGTSVPGLGFTVIYAPQGEVWFPASFGTEFKLRVLFAFHRQIVIAVSNGSFERTHVTSTIHAQAATPASPSQP